MSRRLSAALLLAMLAAPALAYRPFDSTDADVAGPGEFELELGPIGWLREGPDKFRVAPAVVANLGLPWHSELVLEGQREVALDPAPGDPSSSIVDTGVFVKTVLREGALQDASGPSVAAEYGILLPEVHGQSGTGASVAGIVSQRWEAGTLHLNAALAWNREHQPDLFLGAILEGPYSWNVRPIAEIFGEQASGGPRTSSALVGAMWRAREDLMLDLGLRFAHSGDELVREVRLGLTWTFSFKKEPRS
jgi:hypothetical protein